MSKKLSDEEFVVRAITKLRLPDRKGIHTVYSGFNKACGEYTGKNPVQVVETLMAEGKIVGHPTKGGFTIYLPGDGPKNTVQETLNKILAE